MVAAKQTNTTQQEGSIMSNQTYNHLTTAIDTCQPLTDLSPTGKARPWAEHRQEAEVLAYVYDDVNERKAARLRSCAPRLTFEVKPDGGGLKLRNAWFCRVRLCPVCQWRRALKVYGQTTQIIQAANTSRPKGYGWIMLTLTVRNVDGIDLSNELDLMGKAWHRMIKTDAWTRRVKGWMRATEVTHNLDLGSAQYDTFHPHYHCLLQVLPSYFTGRQYMPKEGWAALWQQAARLDYTPQVWVSKVKGSSAAALAEVAKYSAKPKDYIIPEDLTLSADTVMTLDAALAHRRLVAWGGEMKRIKVQLGLDDTEQGDLVHTGDEAEEAAAAAALVAYSWVPGYRQYFKEV